MDTTKITRLQMKNKARVLDFCIAAVVLVLAIIAQPFYGWFDKLLGWVLVILFSIYTANGLVPDGVNYRKQD